MTRGGIPLTADVDFSAFAAPRVQSMIDRLDAMSSSVRPVPDEDDDDDESVPLRVPAAPASELIGIPARASTSATNRRVPTAV